MNNSCCWYHDSTSTSSATKVQTETATEKLDTIRRQLIAERIREYKELKKLEADEKQHKKVPKTAAQLNLEEQVEAYLKAGGRLLKKVPKTSAQRNREYWERTREELKAAAQRHREYFFKLSKRKKEPKTSAQRCREYRARKKLKELKDAEKKPRKRKKEPKTSTQRSREYRARKNLQQGGSQPKKEPKTSVQKSRSFKDLSNDDSSLTECTNVYERVQEKNNVEIRKSEERRTGSRLLTSGIELQVKELSTCSFINKDSSSCLHYEIASMEENQQIEIKEKPKSLEELNHRDMPFEQRHPECREHKKLQEFFLKRKKKPKTPAQRCREYRARKKLKELKDSEKKPRKRKKEPKTGAQRTRECRERKKLKREVELNSQLSGTIQNILPISTKTDDVRKRPKTLTKDSISIDSIICTSAEIRIKDSSNDDSSLTECTNIYERVQEKYNVEIRKSEERRTDSRLLTSGIELQVKELSTYSFINKDCLHYEIASMEENQQIEIKEESKSLEEPNHGDMPLEQRHPECREHKKLQEFFLKRKKEPKTSAQRSREYRARKKLKKLKDAVKKPRKRKKEPKTGAQRNREYRERKKLQKQAEVNSQPSGIIQNSLTVSTKTNHVRKRPKILKKDIISIESIRCTSAEKRNMIGITVESFSKPVIPSTGSEQQEQNPPSISKSNTSTKRSCENRTSLKLPKQQIPPNSSNSEQQKEPFTKAKENIDSSWEEGKSSISEPSTERVKTAAERSREYRAQQKHRRQKSEPKSRNFKDSSKDDSSLTECTNVYERVQEKNNVEIRKSEESRTGSRLLTPGIELHVKELSTYSFINKDSSSGLHYELALMEENQQIEIKEEPKSLEEMNHEDMPFGNAELQQEISIKIEPNLDYMDIEIEENKYNPPLGENSIVSGG